MSKTREAIGRLATIAFAALERRAEHGIAPLRRRHPGPADPRGIVTHVLVVSAVELGDPVVLGIAAVTDDLALHADCEATIHRAGSVQSRRWRSSRNFASRPHTA